MGNRPKRWPIWRIAVATIACATGSGLLIWLSGVAERVVDDRAADPTGPAPVLTMSSLIMVIAVALGLLAALGLFFFVRRVREARTPVWKRKKKKR